MDSLAIDPSSGGCRPTTTSGSYLARFRPYKPRPRMAPARA